MKSWSVNVNVIESGFQVSEFSFIILFYLYSDEMFGLASSLSRGDSCSSHSEIWTLIMGFKRSAPSTSESNIFEVCVVTMGFKPPKRARISLDGKTSEEGSKEYISKVKVLSLLTIFP